MRHTVAMPHLILAGAPTGCWTNLGDEAILAGMVTSLRASIPGVRFTVVTSSPPETYTPYGCESVRFDDLPGLVSAVATSDAVVLGGGSIFFDHWGADATSVLTARHHGTALWTGLALLAAADDIPVVVYDVGAGQLDTADGLLMSRSTFQLASAVTLRDPDSRDRVLSWGLPTERVAVTGDPALQVELPSLPAPTDGDQTGPVLGVALRQWDTGLDEDTWYKSLASAVDAQLERTGGRALFVACHRSVRWPLTDDAAAAAEVIKRMTHADRATSVTADLPWQERAAMLAGCDAVLAMRYHAALFALRTGVPVVGLSYDAKVSGLFADWGRADRCLELSAAGNDPARIGDLLAEPAAGGDAALTLPDLETLQRRESAAAARVADVLGSAPRPAPTTAVRELLSRMNSNADERLPEITAALSRLTARDGAVPVRRRTVAILTNRLLDRKTGEVRIGGAERYGLALARLLHDLGLQPEFYQGGGEFEAGDFFGFPVHPIPFGEEISEFQVGISAEFHRRTADADHVLYLMPNYASGPMREDAVVISHGVWWDHELWRHLELRTPAWLEQLERVFTQPRRVISVDANTGNVVRALFPAADERIRLIPSAVDTNTFRPTVRAEKDEPLVLFPRRAETIRGSHLVGPIMKLVPDPCRFSWVGDGDPKQVAALRKIAQLDARLTVGEAGFDEMPQRYAEADICVIPTLGSEGQSLSCLESMASGAAVVVTRVGGLGELVTDGVDGLVCDPTAEALAAAIRRLVRDPGLRARMGAAARRTALRHSEERWRMAWIRELADLGWLDCTAAANAVPYDVVNFSVINWEQRFQRPQQIAAQWGRRGRRVFYVQIFDDHPPTERPFAVTPIAENVYEVRLALPPDMKLHQSHRPEGTEAAALTALSALRKHWNVDRAISVVEWGAWVPVAVAAREAFGWPVHYDCMDNWSTFPGFSKRPRVLADERELVRIADTMTVSSREIQRHWAVDRPDAVLARNAADFDFFHDALADSDASVPEPLAGIRGPIAGFIGAVVEWFDVEAVRRAALARPDVQFVFAGVVARVDVRPLEALPNVHFLGHQPYDDMATYVRRFDVCLVPFIVNDTTASMDLVKMYEYFAQGKPVVCTQVASMVPYRHLMYLADGPDEFAAQVNRALAESDPSAVQSRITFARMNSWDDRIDTLEELAITTLAENASATDRSSISAGDVLAERSAAALAVLQNELHTAHADLTTTRATLDATETNLRRARSRIDTLNSGRALRLIRRYWAAREGVSKFARRVRGS